MIEKTNRGLGYVLNHMQQRVMQKIGFSVWDYVVATVNKKSKEKTSEPVKILSVGSGPGGTEMNMAKKFESANYHFECVDVNESMLALGQKKADSFGLKFKFVQQDANKLDLPANRYDIVFAHAALHHLINHEHVCAEVKKSMKDGGEFIVYDVIVRNGNLMWPQTKKQANELWSEMPAKYRRDSTKTMENIVDFLPDRDLSVDGFECIRSQDLYDVLKQNFVTKIEVSGPSFARRFVESPFGENYDPYNSEDRMWLEKILKLDREYAKTYGLKPESVFLVLEK